MKAEVGIFHILKRFPAFQKLPDELLHFLSAKSSEHSLEKGERVWRQGEPGEYCVLIVEGLIEIYVESATGEARIIGLFGPGEIIGLSAILKKTPYPAHAMASGKDVKIIKLHIRAMDTELPTKDKTFFQNWQREQLLLHEQILRDKIMMLGAGSLELRLGELFEHLRIRFQGVITGKNLWIPLRLTKTQISKMIEARVETVIRLLNRWEKSGWIHFKPEGIELPDYFGLAEKIRQK